MTSSDYQMCVMSLTGLNRSVNQDYFAFRDALAYVVSDGVGGGAWGEFASQHLADKLSLIQHPDAETLALHFSRIDSEIAAKIEQLGSGLGAAVVAGLWPIQESDSEWIASWVGDCRLSYMCLADGRWTNSWVSTDQTYEQLKMNAPEGISIYAPANMVGCGLSLPPSHRYFKWDQGGRVILASDGFWSVVSPMLLEHEMNQSHGLFSHDMARQLCLLAVEHGSQDDITVMVIERSIQLAA